MTGPKSFNVDEGAHLRESLLSGAVVGAALALVVLPSTWTVLVYYIGVAHDLVALAAAGASVEMETWSLPMGSVTDPVSGLASIADDGLLGAYAVSASAVIALSVLLSLASHAKWSSDLHDGTWMGGRRAPGTAVHGDARLLSSPADLARAAHLWRGDGAPEGTLAVGASAGGIWLIDSIHACILAESGEGKSRRIALATTVANFKQGRSLVINDVKGELRAYLEPYFESAGTHVLVDVMFETPASSARFDPLARAKAAYASEGAGGAVRELRELARCVVPAALKGQPFFTDGARNAFVGIALALIMDDTVPEESKTIMSVAAAIEPVAGEGALDRLMDLAASLPEGHPALAYLGGIGGEGSGGPGIVTTLATYLSEYCDGNVARMLHSDECALDLIGERPTVVFVSSSSATGNYKRLVQTYVSQALSALRSCAARHAGRLPVETVMLLDEAASLGRSERLLQDLGEMRSEGIHVMWFCQSLLQLQSVSGYSKEEAETILDLLKDKVVLSCSNLDTARKLSESMGSYTAVAQSTSTTKGTGTGSTGTSDGPVRRPLISPAELQQWTARRTGALVMHDGAVLAFPSRDVSETFVGGMLGMASPEAERALMEAALLDRVERNVEVPETWRGAPAAGTDAGAAGPDGAAIAPKDGYTPELL